MSSAARTSVTIGLAHGVGAGAAGSTGGGGGGYVGRIIDVTPDRAPEERDQQELIIPIDGGTKTVELKLGEYIVEAFTPSGDLLDERISLTAGDADPAPVRLGNKAAMRDLAWQVASGNLNSALISAEESLRTSIGDDLVQASRASSSVAVRVVLALVPLLLALAASWFLFNTGSAEMSTTSTGPEISASAPAEDQYRMSAEPEEQALNSASAAPEPIGSGLSPQSLPRSGGRAPDFQAKARAPQPLPPDGGGMSGIGWLAILATIGAAAAAAVGVLSRKRSSRNRTAAKADAAGSSHSGAPPSSGSAPAVAAPPTLLNSALLFRMEPGRASWELVDAAAKGPEAIAHLIDRVPFHALESRDAEGFSFYNVSPGDPLVQGDLSRPLFAFVPAAGSAGEVVRVPLPWDLGAASGPAFEIAASTNRSSSFSTGAAIKETSITTMLGYLAAGRLREAELLVRDAEQLLNFKYSNPMAAAAGAYVLLASCKGSSSGKNWRPWIENLYQSFPFADGAILQGWNLLQQQSSPEEVARARGCFLEAVERGLPIYSEGVRLLQKGLAMCEATAAANPELKEALRLADNLAIRCNPSQAFTSIMVTSA